MKMMSATHPHVVSVFVFFVFYFFRPWNDEFSTKLQRSTTWPHPVCTERVFFHILVCCL